MSQSQPASTPAMNAAIKAISEKISHLKVEVKALEDDHANQASGEHKNGCADRDDLEAELLAMKAEIGVLKRSVPEGNVAEDENVNFFLMAAELKRDNDVMRQQLNLTKKNLLSTNKTIDATRAWIAELDEINDLIRSSPGHMDTDKNGAPDDNSDRNIIQDLDNKIRGTRKIYKEIKKFFAEYLQQTKDPNVTDSNSPMARLIQELWNKFNEEKENLEATRPDQIEDTYINISHLDFDVDTGDVTRLLEAGIIEQDLNDHARIRMMDFTE